MGRLNVLTSKDAEKRKNQFCGNDRVVENRWVSQARETIFDQSDFVNSKASLDPSKIIFIGSNWYL